MEIDIKIERVGLDGQGVGYDATGNIYFVARTLPGDLARVRYEGLEKKYRDAELIEILKPSSTRLESPCEYFQQCGGCDYLDWDYSEQLKSKFSIVEHVLQRGELAPKELLPIIGAEKTFHYRNRIQVRQAGEQMGFYRKGTHSIVDVKSCKVAAPEINLELEKLRAEPRPAYATKIELYLDNDGQVHRFENRGHSAGGFDQIHREQNTKLRELVRRALEAHGSQVVLELFCGNGNLTYGYLNQVSQVVAVDGSESAITAARNLKPAEQASKVMFLADEIDRSFPRKLPPELRRYDTLVTDPPRQGMRGVLSHYLHPELRTVVYVSCSPVTFSQDVQCLKKEFSLMSVQPIDMFPHTKHVELVAIWQRR